MKQTCPKCGHNPAISLWQRCLMPLVGEKKQAHCYRCGTPLSNPSWFDIIRLLAMIGVPIASFILTRSKGLMILLFGVVLILTGLISLFCIPLQKHWNVTD